MPTWIGYKAIHEGSSYPGVHSLSTNRRMLAWPTERGGKLLKRSECARRHAKSPQPMRVCGLALIRTSRECSVAVGLHQVLGVGELVELIDVGLGNHDVDGREHE